jgi:hypothetical protein
MKAEWNEQEARRMRESGMTLRRIGTHFGISESVVGRRLNPVLAERARLRDRNRDGTAPISEATVRRETELAARLAEIPSDTRDLTGRLFGDPLPGRRALDIRQPWQPANRAWREAGGDRA